MMPPVYQTLLTDPTVSAYVGDKIFPFGEASQGVKAPYIVWQQIVAAPYNGLDSCPADAVTIQIDCYHPSPVEVVTMADAVRAAIESSAVVTGIPISAREQDTRLYRIALESDWWLDR